jgi:hypothetical protein
MAGFLAVVSLQLVPRGRERSIARVSPVAVDVLSRLVAGSCRRLVISALSIYPSSDVHGGVPVRRNGASMAVGAAARSSRIGRRPRASPSNWSVSVRWSRSSLDPASAVLHRRSYGFWQPCGAGAQFVPADSSTATRNHFAGWNR